MIYLLLTSLVWAFSFGLIGNVLKGVSPYALSVARLGLAALVFAPFLRVRRLALADCLTAAGIGAVQYGLMYLTLFLAYRYAMSHEIAFFTVFTPIYVALFHDALERRFNPLYLATALLAVAGTAVVKYGELTSEKFWAGFGLMQASNACFAFGQVAYRRWRARLTGVRDHEVFALLYAGALLTALAGWGTLGGATVPSLAARQALAVVYLGVIASGVAFFWWNVGATRVNAGALAVFNNLKIPLAVAVSLIVFRESANVPRLLIGGALCLAALGINEAFAPRGRAVGSQNASPQKGATPLVGSES